MPQPLPEPPPSRLPATAGGVRPSHARYWVIVFAVTLAVITYIDRVCISKAAPLIQRDLSLTKEQMGYAFRRLWVGLRPHGNSGGLLGDLIGPREVLMRVVVMWSVFTAATGWAWNALSLMLCRFLFWRRRSGLLPQPHQGFHHLVAGAGTRARTGHYVAQRAVGRGIHTAPGRVGANVRLLAPGFCIVWKHWHLLGFLFLSLVSRSSA